MIAIRCLDKSFHIKSGVIKININNSFKHELSKFLVCWELATTKQKFITEGIFTNGDRCDILNLDACEVIEIFNTEKEASLERKRTEYPMRIIALKADKIINNYLEKYLHEKR
jgi:hypothetical protein